MTRTAKDVRDKYPPPPEKEKVDHPLHYGGKDNPYEAIKVIEAWSLGFHLGNVVKYICRAFSKENPLENLKKAKWYLDREIENIEQKRKEAGL